MKISQPVLILSSVALGLSLVYCQQPAKAKAEQVLQHKLSESEKPAPAHPETGAVAEQVLRQKIAETRTEEKPKIAPETPSATLTPDLDARARELLRLKIAEDRKTNL